MRHKNPLYMLGKARYHRSLVRLCISGFETGVRILKFVKALRILLSINTLESYATVKESCFHLDKIKTQRRRLVKI